jgi:hypothetical protein
MPYGRSLKACPGAPRGLRAAIDVPVGSIRAIEFIADNPGDWPFHCHKSHQTMNAMGHNVRNFIGAEMKRDLVDSLRKLTPEYMPMGSSGMADIAEMAMPAPANTLPMMSGDGQFGPAEMGGMFSIIKIRKDLAANDYRDPGPYDHPAGTVAYEFKDEAGEALRQKGQAQTKMPGMEIQVIKPGAKRGHKEPH